MQNNSTLVKRTIITLTLLVIITGVFFGIKFYNASKNPTTTITNGTKNIPFQSRTTNASGTEIVISNPNTKATDIDSITDALSTTSTPITNRLVHLWDTPVSGFDFVFKDIVIPAKIDGTAIISTTATTSSSTITSTTTVASSSTSTIRSVDEKKVVVTQKTTTVAKIVPLKDTIIQNQEFIYLWDRETGNIFQNLASTSVVSRISNTTLPAIEEAYFLGPTNVFIRGLDDTNENISTKYLSLFKETATSTFYTANTTDSYMNTKQVSILADSQKIFYFINKIGQGVLSNADGSGYGVAIKTTLTEWLTQYVNKNTLAITTKPSAYFPGFLFFVTTNGSGSNQYILGDKYGLTTLVSPDGQKVLYSEIINNTLETAIYNINTKKTVYLSQDTLSEKCVWTSDSSLLYCAIPQLLATLPYPDVWYQGKTNFADNIWSIDPLTGDFKVVVGLQNRVSTPIDAYNLKVSKNKKYLLFQDKYSLTLWKYNLVF